MNGMKYQKQFALTTGFLTGEDKIRPYAVLDLFQEVAGAHAEELGIGFQALYHRNMIWVLLRTKYDVIQEPKPSSSVIVTTWPRPLGRADFDRDYFIHSETGELLIKGTNKWVIIDVNTRRLVRSSSITYPGEFCLDKTYEEPLASMTLLEVSKDDYQYDHMVRTSDLDHNNHMNNAKYAEIVLNVLQLEEGESISSFEINHQKEAQLNQTFQVYRRKIDDTIFIIGKTENQVYFSALVYLKK